MRTVEANMRSSNHSLALQVVKVLWQLSLFNINVHFLEVGRASHVRHRRITVERVVMLLLLLHDLG